MRARFGVARLAPAGAVSAGGGQPEPPIRTREIIVRRTTSAIAPLVCASLSLPALPVAQAIAAPVAKTTIIKTDDGVTLVGRRGWGPGALFGGIIAGALIATAIREGRADDRDMRRCDED